ncbi:MAG: glycosyltransferase family 4 protein [Candidatus Giovannonibacteria bacterium]|nr:MAG: glycosyltransferase family 4 protein [Candidatus Giovannonibacteria bacterium]
MPDLNKKTKILYVITKSNWGGAQRYVYDTATSLDKEVFDIAVAAGGEGVLTEKLNRAGIRTIPIPFLQRDISIIKEFLSLFALLKIFKSERPDIIHLNSSKAGGLGALAARISSLVTRHSLASLHGRSGPLIVFTAHGWGFNEDRPYVARLIIFLAQWITVIFCHKIITLSRAMHSQAMYFPFSRKKIFFTEQGLRPAELLPREEAKQELTGALSKTNSGNKEFPGLWVGCVAELTKNKGVVYLIEAAGKLTDHDFRLLILGSGEDGEKLRLQISDTKLQDKVFLLGFVLDAAKYFKSFDIFVLPSVTEALGYTLIEAGQAGLPVVATKVGGIPWIIKDGESGILVPPKNPEALAGAIKKLLDDGGLRQQMGQKNHELVSQKFSFDKMLKETVDIYTKP